jgi:hypothetical protein
MATIEIDVDLDADIDLEEPTGKGADLGRTRR